MSNYRNVATQILELYQYSPQVDIMPFLDNLTEEEKRYFYSHILEFYGGSFAEGVMIKTFDLFEETVLNDIHKTISMMKHNKLFGIETLCFFLICHTSVKFKELKNLINDDSLIHLDKIFNKLENINIYTCCIVSDRKLAYYDLSEIEISKIKKFRLPSVEHKE